MQDMMPLSSKIKTVKTRGLVVTFIKHYIRTSIRELRFQWAVIFYVDLEINCVALTWNVGVTPTRSFREVVAGNPQKRVVVILHCESILTAVWQIILAW